MAFSREAKKVKSKFYILKLLVLLLFCPVVNADPWFTGPLFALSGIVTPLGHGVFSLYLDNAHANGTFQQNGDFMKTPRFGTTYLVPEILYGLTDDIDFQLNLSYLENETKEEFKRIHKVDKKSSQNLGDTLMILGFQIFKQNNHKWRPSLRLTVEEDFPTGHYDGLNPRLLGTDGTGIGSYQTQIALNFQHLLLITEQHALMSRACFAYNYASTVPIHGFSVYGGTPSTQGHIAPGNNYSIDLAAELSVTKNWVAVMEGLFLSQQASHFNGIIDSLPNIRKFTIIPSKHNIGKVDIGNGHVTEFMLAPALEYNFSEHIGVIAGSWFIIKGQNTPAFISAMLQLTTTW